jgi:sn-glycerol 3-phosphate transport system substrate-binding protein
LVKNLIFFRAGAEIFMSTDRRFLNLSLALFSITLSFTLFSLVGCYKAAQEPTMPNRIVVWHGFDGALGKIFESIVSEYNQLPETRQAQVQVVTEFKGNYDQTLDAGLNVAGTPQAPHLLQVYEMGTLKVLKLQDEKQIFVPLAEVMADKSLDESLFLPTIVQFYRARTSKLNSMPFNASTVVLYYNKTALDRAGISGSEIPATWEEFTAISRRLKQTGTKNILAFGWLTGHGIDQTAARHNVPVATNGNGIDNDSSTMVFSQSEFFNYHFNWLKEMYAQEIFTLTEGPAAEKLFGEQEIVFLTQGANRLPLLENHVKGQFEIGVAPFPYWEKFTQEPHNTIAGGASFWVLAGHEKRENQLAARFLRYLVSVSVQKKWHMETGFVPVIKGVRELCDQEGFYTKDLRGKTALLALESLMRQEPKEYSRGILLPSFPEIRKIQIEELTAAVKNEKSVDEALQAIDQRANELLKA